jgi:hypothetical protein
MVILLTPAMHHNYHQHDGNFTGTSHTTITTTTSLIVAWLLSAELPSQLPPAFLIQILLTPTMQISQLLTVSW